MKDIRYQVYYNIKRLREINGHKQQTVANVLGITQTAYSRIENGESNISLEHILKLCEFYSITPEVFFNWNGEVSIPQKLV